MNISTKKTIPLTVPHESLDELANLEKEKIQLILLEDIKRGLSDVKAGRTLDALSEIRKLRNSKNCGVKL